MSDQTAVPTDAFDRFMLAEYEHIAQAHFATIDTLSTFFRHYILIVSLPIPIAAVFLHPSWWTTEVDMYEAQPHQFLQSHPYIISLALWLLVLAGIMVLCYLINLRHDALLYARTVNGIRNYFYGRSRLDFGDERRIRVLPRSIRQPQYLEPFYFMFVVAAILILHILYAAAGCLIWDRLGALTGWQQTLVWSAPLLAVVGLHIAAYCGLSWHREHRYLSSCADVVGVDIDGVLNRHREHFCELLKRECGKDVAPDQITTIPVHKCKDLDVTREDERVVFNHPDYWTAMPVLQGAAQVLTQLSNVLGHRIWVFTHRPWPDFSEIPEMEDELAQLWICQDIEAITSSWLEGHKIPFDKLTIEGVGVSTRDPLSQDQDRFVIAKEAQIRFFIEDDMGKARKLSTICEVVFLIDHPYNQTDTESLPPNVVRVTDWREIGDYVFGESRER